MAGDKIDFTKTFFDSAKEYKIKVDDDGWLKIMDINCKISSTKKFEAKMNCEHQFIDFTSSFYIKLEKDSKPTTYRTGIKKNASNVNNEKFCQFSLDYLYTVSEMVKSCGTIPEWEDDGGLDINLMILFIEKFFNEPNPYIDSKIISTSRTIGISKPSKKHST